MSTRHSPTSPTARRSYGGISADTRHAIRRERLIEAALQMFGSDGYATTSIESLCSQAGVSTRNFYDHFDSREGLLIAVYDRITEESQRAIAQSVSEPHLDIEAQARAGIQAFAHAMLDDERYARINFIEVIGASRRVEAHRREVIRSFATIIETIADELMRTGAIPTRDARTASLGLIGAVQEVLRDWVTGSERPPLNPIINELVRLFTAAAST